MKFAVVGGLGAVIDLGGAAVLHGKFHMEGLEAKAISTTIATVLTYLGSRFWTFKHRENQALGREAGLFIGLNVVGLLIAEAVIALVTYGLGLHSQLEYNAASVIGTGLATIFRYFAYRQWVFTAPTEQSVLVPADPELAPVPDYPPWEGDPAFLAAEMMAPASASAAPAGWNSADAAAPSWQSDPSQARTWDRSDESTQPWSESSVISNETVASSPPPTSADSAEGLNGGADPAASGARGQGQGRHRRS